MDNPNVDLVVAGLCIIAVIAGLWYLYKYGGNGE